MSETRQRWRLVFARDEEARYLSHLDAVKLWERAFRRGAIPIATTEGFSPRPRLVFAAPLPLGMLAEHELADLYLAERLTQPDLRGRLERGLPRGYRLLALHDEWVGAPTLATQLVAADYRMTIVGADRPTLARAVDALLAADRLDREKRREAKAVAYDLRPLLIGIEVREAADPRPNPADSPADADSCAEVWMRLRNSQERGSGRAEEVVAALAEEIASIDPGPVGPRQAPGGEPVVRPGLEMLLAVRERLWLASELAS